MKFIKEIKDCSDCPHRDHSGAFTPGGARPLCGHRDACNIKRASRKELKEKYPSHHKEQMKENWKDWGWHWIHRVLDKTKDIPEWCPLKYDPTRIE